MRERAVAQRNFTASSPVFLARMKKNEQRQQRRQHLSVEESPLIQACRNKDWALVSQLSIRATSRNGTSSKAQQRQQRHLGNYSSFRTSNKSLTTPFSLTNAVERIPLRVPPATNIHLRRRRLSRRIIHTKIPLLVWCVVLPLTTSR